MSFTPSAGRLSLIVTNPGILQHGSAPAHIFDGAGGTIGSQNADWILVDGKKGIHPTHCEIVKEDGDFCVVDRSGLTRINRSSDGMGVGRIARLNDGDVIHVGLYKIVVHLQNQEHASLDADRHLRQHQLGELLNEEDSHYLGDMDHIAHDDEEIRLTLSPEQAAFQEISSPQGLRAEMDPLRALDTAALRLQPKPESRDPLDTTHYGRSTRQKTQADLASTRFEAVAGSPRPGSGEYAMPHYPSTPSPVDEWQSAYRDTGTDTRHLATIPLLQGLEVPLGQLDSEAAHYLLLEAGKALKEAIQGIAALYGAQTGDADRLSLLTRTLQPIEDNPLRLKQSYDDTVRALFSSERSAVHLSPQAAINESLHQAKQHNAATIKAIGESLDALLRAFSPEVLLQRFQRYASAQDRQQQSDGWVWQMYTHYYNELASSRQQGFEKLFWEVFEQAYDRAIRAEQA